MQWDGWFCNKPLHFTVDSFLVINLMCLWDEMCLVDPELLLTGIADLHVLTRKLRPGQAHMCRKSNPMDAFRLGFHPHHSVTNTCGGVFPQGTSPCPPHPCISRFSKFSYL